MSKQKSMSATMRLKSDYMRIKRDPIPFIDAEPLPSNILEWYNIRGLQTFLQILFKLF